MTRRMKRRLPQPPLIEDDPGLLGRDISFPIRYTVDPRVGSPNAERPVRGRQNVRCHDQGQRTRPRTTAIEPSEPAPTLVAAQQIATILIRFADWLVETRGGQPRTLP